MVVSSLIGGAVGGAGVNIIIRAFDNFSGTFDKANKKATDLARQQKVLAGALIGVGAAGLVLTGALAKVAANFEQTEIAFETLLGNAAESKKLLKELTDFAAKTPFTLPGVERAGRQLLAFGFEAKELLPVLKSVGDVASGLGLGQEGLDRLILNLGQVRAQAKLTGRELRDFAIAGVPLLETLATQLNVTTQEISEMVSRGQISSEAVVKAFENMSSGTGRFANLMQKQMKSLQGQMSNLEDSIIILAREFGKALLPILKVITATLKGFIGILDSIPAPVKSVIAITILLGSALAVLGGTILLFNTTLLPAFTAGWRIATGAMVAARTATIALTVSLRALALLLSPAAFIVGGLVIIAGILLKVTGLWDKLTSSIGRMFNPLKRTTDEFLNVTSAMNASLTAAQEVDAEIQKRINELLPGEFAADERIAAKEQELAELRKGAQKDITLEQARQIEERIKAVTGELQILKERFKDQFVERQTLNQRIADLEKLRTTILEQETFKRQNIEIRWQNTLSQTLSLMNELARVEGVSGRIPRGLFTQGTATTSNFSPPILPSANFTPAPITINIENIGGVDADDISESLMNKFRRVSRG